MGFRRRVLAGIAAMTMAMAAYGDEPAVPDSQSQGSDEDGSPSTPMRKPERIVSMNEVASDYVKLALALGQFDPDYIDAYYGPPEWRDEVKQHPRSLRQIMNDAQELISTMSTAASVPVEADLQLLALRKVYLKNQLGSLSARARLLTGYKMSFDNEARALFDINPPHYSEADFEPALKQIDGLLPKGAGTLAQRYNRYVDRFNVPRAKLEQAMRIAIDAARASTVSHLPLPDGERFDLVLVSDKPWSAYNWYKGHYLSRIEINTDLPVTVSRIIELAAHEGYPGHHVYNSLLENHLGEQLHWPEYQVYALYSPQSAIAEGSANFGARLAFAGDAGLELTRKLFDTAGFDAGQAQAYFEITAAAKALEPAEIEAARRYVDGTADANATLAWLETYTLASPARAKQRLEFFRHYRSYIVNYSFGEEVVRRFVEKGGSSVLGSEAQWQGFLDVLTVPHTPTAMERSDAGPGGALLLLPPTLAPPGPNTPNPVVYGIDLVAFQHFMASKPTPADFRKKYPKIVLILPGGLVTKELRTDNSRYFADIDLNGRIVGGRFN